MTDTSWYEEHRLETSIRSQMAELAENDAEILRLVDLLPLPAGLLSLGAQLGETETDLRRERRDMFAFAADETARSVASGTAVFFSPAAVEKLKKLTGRQSVPEITIEIIGIKMVADRITKVQTMARA